MLLETSSWLNFIRKTASGLSYRQKGTKEDTHAAHNNLHEMAHSATYLMAIASHRLDKITCSQLPWFHLLSTIYQQIRENTKESQATTAICPLFLSLDACQSLKTKHRQEAALSRFHSSREKRPTFYPFLFTKTARLSAATSRLTTS